MKISLNWVKEYTEVKLSVDKLVQKIGAQLGEVEEVIDLGKKYHGIVVAKVVSCEKHPNADKLSICLIDDGGVTKHIKRDKDGNIQVVCGAPNVHAGMLVAWLPPGVTVPSSFDKDKFVLESRDFRGQISNGMLASAQELDLGDDHSGILDLNPQDAKPGDDFAKTYRLDDHIIDIENKMFTHRPDLFGILGVAREIAGIQQLPFKSPDWYTKPSNFSTVKAHLPLSVKVEDHKLTPRFMAVAMSIKRSNRSIPWLITYLSRVGVRPINLVVDITNYLQYLTAQPLHAYDYDKVVALSGGKSAELIARPAKKGEKLQLLGGKEITLVGGEIVIATSKHVIGLAGVMGGAETEVDDNTKNIILESANFDMYAIRKASMQHGLFTDAVTRFNKGQSPLQNDKVLGKAISMTEQLLAGEVAGPVHDIKSRLKESNRVSVTPDFVNQRLGSNLSLKDMTKLLENVEFKMMSVPASQKRLHVQAPFWRTDIEIPEDIVEEIGRLYGYDRLPLELPTRTIEPVRRNQLLDFKDLLRRKLAEAGANELLTYSFVHRNLLEKVGQKPKDAYQLSNAISPDLQYYRLSLLPSLLEKVQPNLKSDRVRGDNNELAIFEINPVHAKGLVDKDDLPIEDHRLALVIAADDKTAKHEYSGVAYYQAQLYLTTLLESLGIDSVLEPASEHRPELSISQAAIAPFDRARTAVVKTPNGDFLGELGEFRAEVRRNLKLPAFSAGFEVDVKQLLKQALATGSYEVMPRFPKVVQDITLSVPKKVDYRHLQQVFDEAVSEYRPENSWTDVELLGVYQADKHSQNKNYTFRIWVSHFDRTLKSTEVSELLDSIATKASEVLSAERV